MTDPTIEAWTRANAEYTEARAEQAWAEEISRDVWHVPESELSPAQLETACRCNERCFGLGLELIEAYGAAANGFEILDLIEIQAPPAGETHERYEYVTADWGRKWPAEEIWRARLRRPAS